MRSAPEAPAPAASKSQGKAGRPPAAWTATRSGASTSRSASRPGPAPRAAARPGPVLFPAWPPGSAAPAPRDPAHAHAPGVASDAALGHVDRPAAGQFLATGQDHRLCAGFGALCAGARRPLAGERDDDR